MFLEEIFLVFEMIFVLIEKLIKEVMGILVFWLRLKVRIVGHSYSETRSKDSREEGVAGVEEGSEEEESLHVFEEIIIRLILA